MPVKSIPITLNDGKERHLRYDYNALCLLEGELKISIVDIGRIMASSGTLTQIRAILWAGLIHEDEGLTQKDVGNLIEPKEFPAVAKKIAEAFEAAFPVEADSKKGEGLKPEESGTGSNT